MKWLPWVQATRPKTLPVSLFATILGSSFAAASGAFEWKPALLCTAFGMLSQILSNYANDYFDHFKGADVTPKKGFVRVVAGGLVTPRAMVIGMAVVACIALAVGIQLLAYGEPWFWIVGIACIACAVGYTAGPYPFSYHGLGEVFVFLFFGLVAVNMTFYVQAQYMSVPVFSFSVAYGLLASNVLALTSYRDIETDRLVNKRTLGVRFGPGFVHWQYGISALIALMIAVYFGMQGAIGYYGVLVVLWPIATVMRQWIREGKHYDFVQGLKGTVKTLALYVLIVTATNITLGLS